MKHPLITLLTDFGLADHYVAAMKGVLLGMAPEARIVDISHEVGAFGITEAAFTLAQAAPWFPPGTIHLVVVDPGVGSSRRPLISRAHGQYFVAPDNGILTMVWDAGPKHREWEISVASRRVGQVSKTTEVSKTFHGRDIFAPAAARLARGVRPSRLGRRISDCQRLEIAKARHTGPKSWAGEILKVDRFGNAITNFPSELWAVMSGKPFIISVSGLKIQKARATYAEGLPGELFVISGSTGFLEIATNQGSAAAIGGMQPGSATELRIG